MTAPKSSPRIKTVDVLAGLKAVRDKHHLVSIKGSALSGAFFDLRTTTGQRACLDWISDRQDEKANVYFHANPVKPGFTGIKAGKADILCGTHAQVDLDMSPDTSLNYEVRRSHVEDKLKIIEKNSPPSVTIDSGNGFNLLWELETPLGVDEYEKRNAAFNAFHGASGTWNVDRILKVPGTMVFNDQAKIKNKGYPHLAQGALVGVRSTKTDFDRLPHKTVPTGEAGSGGNKGVLIHVPDVTKGEKKRLIRLMKENPGVLDALRKSHESGSHGLFAVAGACFSAGLDSLDYAGIVAVAEKSEAHAHVFKTGDATAQARALGRAWAGVRNESVAGRDMLQPIGGDAGVAPSAQREDMADVFGEDAVKDWEERVSRRGMADRMRGAFTFADVQGGRFDPLAVGSWLWKGLLPETGMGVLYGPPGCGKSFVGLDMICRGSVGLDWHGHRCKVGGSGKSWLYVSSEGGGAEAKRRLLGWSAHNGMPPGDVIMYPGSFRFGAEDGADADALVAWVRDQGLDLALVVVDTLARNMDGDENATKDMGAFVRDVDRVWRSCGCFAMVVHHTGKDADRGARGSSALLGAVDVEIRLERDFGCPNGRIIVTKNRQGLDGMVWGYELKDHVFGVDADGDDVTTKVIERVSAPAPAGGGSAGRKVSPMVRVCWDVYGAESGGGTWATLEDMGVWVRDHVREEEAAGRSEFKDAYTPAYWRSKIRDWARKGMHGWELSPDEQAVKNGAIF